MTSVMARHREHQGLWGRHESPRQAATRESLEESGQKPDGPLRFIGYADFVLAPAHDTSRRSGQGWDSG
ncbi:hypothetical protein [Streptomyces adelaidensis]|uniref:hypothetical protein n=1 Tax=Streptomyces adelaidensis TaxID=2796465 RepID=UPI0019088CBB|nr:hypothetical protein [Streptomyces adelaidensis]